jgi:hypothetical protein
MPIDTNIKSSVKPAVSLGSDRSVQEALAAMTAEGIEYGIVTMPDASYGGLVSKARLATQDQTSKLSTVVANDPPRLSVAGDISLDQAAAALASEFIGNVNLDGAIVEGDSLQVLPRKIILDHARTILNRTVSDRLEGAPLDLVYYVCPKADHERKMVKYYTGVAPLCSQGHTMELEE